MQKYISETITSNGKELVVTVVSLSDSLVPDTVIKVIKEAFEKLAPFIKDERQVIYLIITI
jgi:hypothetical protein